MYRASETLNESTGIAEGIAATSEHAKIVTEKYASYKSGWHME